MNAAQRHVVMYSGGVGSFAAAERVMRQFGRRVTLLFTDTLIEDADLYRFLIESAAYLLGAAGVDSVSGLVQRASATPPSSDMPARRAHLDALRTDTRAVLPGLVWIADGRTPWEVFAERKFLGNSRLAHCTFLLKQDVAAAWLEANCDPSSTVCYVGIDWMEEHRFTRLRAIRAEEGWEYEAPLCRTPTLLKDGAFKLLATTGIAAPRLYALGFAHNNCGGGCVKAGIGHFSHLYRTLPDVYAEWEQGETTMRAQLGDVAILTDRSEGGRAPLPLVQLRRRLDDGYQPDLFDLGGCGCFIEAPKEAA